ncbi:MAG: restriction endonuclease subunit S [Chloroflexi bacterium]|nr:restriction endonuclease subunit S [Chloroflexota bacterium]
MASEWCDVTLGDVVELKRGYDLPQQNRTPGDVPLVSSSGVTDHHSEAMVKGPGVVTGRYGTLGQVFYISEDFWPLNTTLYVRDFKGNDPRFIGYFLRSLDFFAYSDKAAVPGLNRNHLHQAKVRVPADIAEQRAIAHILGTLDDKIELNRRLSATLEAMARALFQSWFVDFDPVRARAAGRDPGLPPHLAALFPDGFEESALGVVPRGWVVRALDEVAHFLNGLALQKYTPGDGPSLPVIKIVQLRTGNVGGADRASADIAPAYVVNDGDILFSWSGSLECVLWAGGGGALNQHLFKVTPKAGYPRWLAYWGIHQHLDDFRYIAAGKATTMGHIQRHHLSEALLAVPSPERLAEFGPILTPMTESLWQRAVESRTLATMRDALLPKLISGEVRVGEAARTVAEAGA